MTIQQKYNTKAAALYRDKVLICFCSLLHFIMLFLQISAVAQGKTWEAKKSPAQNYTSSYISPTQSQSYSSSSNNYSSSYQSSYNNTESYQAGYQNYNSAAFKDEKEAFFARKQAENATKRE